MKLILEALVKLKLYKKICYNIIKKDMYEKN